MTRARYRIDTLVLGTVLLVALSACSRETGQPNPHSEDPSATSRNKGAGKTRVPPKSKPAPKKIRPKPLPAPKRPSRPTGPPPPLDESNVVKTPLGMYDLYFLARPVVSRLAHGDPVSMAIRWQQGDKIRREHPEDMAKRNPDLKLLVRDTVDSLRFEITPPGGKKRVYSVEYDYPTSSYRRNTPRHVFRTDGMFITFTETGITTEQGITGRWLDDARVTFRKPGKYTVRVHGALFLLTGDSPRFVSEPVEFTVGARDHKSLKSIRDIADSELKRRLPDTELMQEQRREGLLDGVIVENMDGNRLVRYGLKTRRLWSLSVATVIVTPQGEIAGFEDRDISNCIAVGTPVETERGLRPIEALQPGDRVWGYDLDHERRVLTEVRTIRASYARTILRAGPTLRLTPSHPVYAGGIWQPASEARGAWLRSDGRLQSVAVVAERDEARVTGGAKPSTSPEATLVYDLTVDAPHTFFAGGYLVHNKSRGYIPALDDPWVFMWNPKQPPQVRRKP